MTYLAWGVGWPNGVLGWCMPYLAWGVGWPTGVLGWCMPYLASDVGRLIGVLHAVRDLPGLECWGGAGSAWPDLPGLGCWMTYLGVGVLHAVHDLPGLGCWVTYLAWSVGAAAWSAWVLRASAAASGGLGGAVAALWWWPPPGWWCPEALRSGAETPSGLKHSADVRMELREMVLNPQVRQSSDHDNKVQTSIIKTEPGTVRKIWMSITSMPRHLMLKTTMATRHSNHKNVDLHAHSHITHRSTERI